MTDGALPRVTRVLGGVPYVVKWLEGNRFYFPNRHPWEAAGICMSVYIAKLQQNCQPSAAYCL